ncbi:protein of unknown function [Agrobacterium pusense]|uniref:Uncharacterized protein n=1 Tax=Agrobacterium pusense TaxID=648995 RepID=U4Q0H0_9HYPH|nr:protein of unknown function [Agrobacterium pusense]
MHIAAFQIANHSLTTKIDRQRSPSFIPALSVPLERTSKTILVCEPVSHFPLPHGEACDTLKTLLSPQL